MSLPPLVQPSLRDRPTRVGLEWQGRTYRFDELDERSGRLAGELKARGLVAGDRLAAYLPNRLEFIDLLLACLRTGIVLVPINILYREREAGHILADAAPSALVLAGEPPVRSDVPCWPIDDLVEAAAARDVAPWDPAADEAPAAIIYTSGTTGAAKGAVLTRANLAANASTLAEAWRFEASDRLLLALPLFHVHGLGNGLGCWLRSGCTLRLLERFDRQTIAAEFLDFRPTVFFGVPTMYARLMEIDGAVAREIGERVRLFVSGSAPLSADLHRAFGERFGHAILERYGMTETLMVLGNPYDGERRAGTVGGPFPDVSVRIVSGQGEAVPDGVEGELLVRSPMLFAGYWNDPAATAAAFADGWFRTGDIAVRSADGYYTLAGRKSDAIISGGFNIYPQEVEDVLGAVEGVAEVAIAGAPDPIRGEVPVAFVVARDAAHPPDPAALEAACRAVLASFKVPRRFVFVEQLPRTALGKVQRTELARTARGS